VAQPLAKHAQIKGGNWQGSRIFSSEILHFFTITKEFEKFITLVPGGGNAS